MVRYNIKENDLFLPELLQHQKMRKKRKYVWQTIRRCSVLFKRRICSVFVVHYVNKIIRFIFSCDSHLPFIQKNIYFWTNCVSFSFVLTCSYNVGGIYILNTWNNLWNCGIYHHLIFDNSFLLHLSTLAKVTCDN